MELLTKKWCHLEDDAYIVIVTDKYMLDLAEEIKHQAINTCEIIIYDSTIYNYEKLLELSPKDLLIAMFSIDTYIFKGANKEYQPFGKPRDLCAKYAFIRLNITKESLLQGLGTPKNLIYETLDRFSRIKNGSKVHVTNKSGTDIILEIDEFEIWDHEIFEDGGMAFLPPSETPSYIPEGKSNGKIVIDMTVGQLYHYGKLVDWFGLVDQPVTLTIESGLVTDITGGAMAIRLRDRLFSMDPACRKIVELGKGLSRMSPTGNIGVDESILDSCHFGLGNASECGVHLDLVLSDPVIKVLD